MTTLAFYGCAGDPFVTLDDSPNQASSAGQPDDNNEGELGTNGSRGPARGEGGAATGAGTATTGGNAASVPGAGGSSTQGGAGEESPTLAGAGGDEATVVTPTNTFDLIDDIEGAFPTLPARAGRNGAWFMVHDDSGGYATDPTAVELAPPRAGSQFAARVSGWGFTDWGAQIGVSLKSPATGYDASQYCGVRFLARGTTAGWSVLVSDRASVPDGGVCDPGSWDPATRCFHSVGKALAPSASWQEYKIRFADLRYLDMPASSRRLDPSALYDIMFNVQNGSGETFELEIDDLSFIGKTSADCQ